MPSPFPGMDPYLEGRGNFPGLHNMLAAEIAGILNQLLPAAYYAKVDIRLELGIAGSVSPQIRVPDVTVAHDPWAKANGGIATLPLPEVRTEISPHVEFDVQTELLEVPFIEIREPKSNHELVTLIEILSPSNKLPGRDRAEYLDKRGAILQSPASLIEIDLLRIGDHVWNEPDYYEALASLALSKPYLVAINRGWKREGIARHAYQIFPFGLHEMLPVIPIPLRQSEPEPTLDLQYAFTLAYDRGPYRRGAVKYSDTPPPPAFAPEDYEWVKQQTQKFVPQ